MTPIRVVIQQPSLAKYRVPVFRELARHPGIDLKVVYGNRAGIINADPDGFAAEMHPLWRRKLGPFPLYWHQPQWSYARRGRADVLILTWNSQYLSLAPALWRARLNGIGTIVWGHGYSKHESWWRRGMRARLATWADAVLFYNQSTANDFVNTLHFNPDKIFVAKNALDQEPIEAASAQWRQRPDELAAFARQHDLQPGPVILFVSRLHPDNHLDWLLQAAQRLLGRFPELRVVIVGGGEDERQKLRGLAAALQLEKHVQFPGPLYEEQALAPWFLNSQVFCYPANVGLSLLHAFGYGLPVITSDNVSGQNPEIDALRDGVNGLMFRDGDIDDLAHRLECLLVDEALRRRLGQAALRTVREEFSIQQMVAAFAAAAQFAATRHRRTP